VIGNGDTSGSGEATGEALALDSLNLVCITEMDRGRRGRTGGDFPSCAVMRDAHPAAPEPAQRAPFFSADKLNLVLIHFLERRDGVRGAGVGGESSV